MVAEVTTPDASAGKNSGGGGFTIHPPAHLPAGKV
jgi:hypothetical protein